MQNENESVKEKVTFYLSAAVYLLFNLRLGADALRQP